MANDTSVSSITFTNVENFSCSGFMMTLNSSGNAFKGTLAEGTASPADSLERHQVLPKSLVEEDTGRWFQVLGAVFMSNFGK